MTPGTAAVLGSEWTLGSKLNPTRRAVVPLREEKGAR
jgi:hypothetical protein